MLAQFAFGIWCIVTVSLYLAVIVPRVWVLLMSTRNGIFGRCLFRWRNTWLDSGYMLCVSTLVIMDEFHTFSQLRQTWILMRSFSIRFKWRSVPSRSFWLQFCFVRIALGNSGRTFMSFTWLRCVMTDRVFRCSVRHFSASSSELRPWSAK